MNKLNTTSGISFISVFIFLLLSLSLKSQDGNEKRDSSSNALEFISLKERQLASHVRLFMSFKEEIIRKKYFDLFHKGFSELIKNQETLEYPFDSLKNVSKLTQKDNKFRLYTWSYPERNGTYKYFGTLQINNDKNPPTLIPLKDMSEIIYRNHSQVNFQKLSDKKWLGCIYYDMIEQTIKEKKVYTLLGWDGNSVETQKKVIETMYITPSNKIAFGIPLFDVKKDYRRLRIKKDSKKKILRLVYEYSGTVSMKLTYDQELKIIVMDNLSSFRREIKGDPRFYSPDLTYNTLSFIKGQWVMRSNVKLEKIRKEQKLVEDEN